VWTNLAHLGSIGKTGRLLLGRNATNSREMILGTLKRSLFPEKKEAIPCRVRHMHAAAADTQRRENQ